LIVVEAAGLRRALLARMVRSCDAVARGSRPERWLAGILGRPRLRPATACADLRVVATRIVAELAAAGAASGVGWIDGRSALPSTVREAEEAALLTGRLERERRALFTAVGHELRTPLTSARGYLEVLLSDPPRRRAEVRRFLEIAQRETLRAARLVDGLFELSLLETGAGALRVEPGDLAAAARAAVESLALEARGRRVCLRRRLRPAPALLDAERATQAALNLVHNAIKFARSAVRVETARTDGRVVLTVEDDGPGFSDGDLETIPAFLRRGSAASRAEGSGVGLALSETVAALHGGRLFLERSSCGGARVRLVLPAGRERSGAVLINHGAKAIVRPSE